MNWLLRIREILGRFWTDIFGDSDFLLAVEFCQQLYGKLIQGRNYNWREGHIAASKKSLPDYAPFVVLIPEDTLHKEASDYRSMFYVGEWQSVTEHGGWVATPMEQIPEPFMMTDHVAETSRTLINGLDYTFKDGEFLFFVDPRTLTDIPRVRIADGRGGTKICWKLFGWRADTSKLCDPVAGFISNELNDCADIAWDIHQNGATPYNVKKLLAACSDSVISDNDGVVDCTWKEGSWYCIQVSGSVYKGRKVWRKAPGDTVRKGDVLFGTMQAYKGSETPDNADIPGILVRTDAGELMAYNEDTPSVSITGTTQYTLPLQGASASAYHDICTELTADLKVPYIDVPETVNPYLFVTQTLRRGRCMSVRLTVDDVKKMAAALQCIRVCVCESGIVNVYVQAETDIGHVVVSGFEASVGLAAVAVEATITIQEMCAEAEVLL